MDALYSCYMVVIHTSWLYFKLPHLAVLSCACMCTNSTTPHALYCVSIAKWIPPTSCCTSWMHCYGCNTRQLTILQITSLSSIVMCTNSKAPCALHWKLCFIAEWIPLTLCFLFQEDRMIIKGSGSITQWCMLLCFLWVWQLGYHAMRSQSQDHSSAVASSNQWCTGMVLLCCLATTTYMYCP